MKLRHLSIEVIQPLNEYFKAVCFVRVPGSLLYRVTAIPEDIGLDIEQTKRELTRFCIHHHNGVWYFRLRSDEETEVVGEALKRSGIEPLFFEPDNTQLN